MSARIYEYTGGTISKGIVITSKATARGYRINRKSPAYARLMKAGFDLPDLEYQEGWITGEIRCVCGRVERYWLASATYLHINGIVDIASYIENLGAVSIKHLKDDGFSPEEIKRIRNAYI